MYNVRVLRRREGGDGERASEAAYRYNDNKGKLEGAWSNERQQETATRDDNRDMSRKTRAGKYAARNAGYGSTEPLVLGRALHGPLSATKLACEKVPFGAPMRAEALEEVGSEGHVRFGKLTFHY